MSKFDTDTLWNVKKGEKILDAIARHTENPKEILGAVAGGRLIRLDATAESAMRIQPLTIRDADGFRIYYHTVTTLFLAAAANVLPDRKIAIEHFIGDALYAEGRHKEPMTTMEIQAIEERMRRLVEEDAPIERRRLSRDEAFRVFSSEEMDDSDKLYRGISEEEIDITVIDGEPLVVHNYLAPSASYVPHFRLQTYYPGVLLLFGSGDDPTRIPPFREQRGLARMYRRSKDWLLQTGLSTVGDVNDKIARGQGRLMIQLADQSLENRLHRIAETIVQDDDVRVILIAGPSASGKTTTSRKLAIHMGSMGKFPLTISMDDYFVDRDKTPLDPDGTPNYEHTDAIDIEAFNRDMLALLEGQRVRLPLFDFVSGRRTMSDRYVKIDRMHPIIVEGIHGLNPIMTAQIPEKNKCKLYVTALAQLNLDDHNRISATDSRFLRRLVRDTRTRGHDPEQAFTLWTKVRRSEDTEIFTFQEEADYSVDTSLVYELFVLKDMAIQQLEKVSPSHFAYKDAVRLRALLRYFASLDESLVDSRSVLREFIGGSVYEESTAWM